MRGWGCAYIFSENFDKPVWILEKKCQKVYNNSQFECRIWEFGGSAEGASLQWQVAFPHRGQAKAPSHWVMEDSWTCIFSHSSFTFCSSVWCTECSALDLIFLFYPGCDLSQIWTSWDYLYTSNTCIFRRQEDLWHPGHLYVFQNLATILNHVISLLHHLLIPVCLTDMWILFTLILFLNWNVTCVNCTLKQCIDHNDYIVLLVNNNHLLCSLLIFHMNSSRTLVNVLIKLLFPP